MTFPRRADRRKRHRGLPRDGSGEVQVDWTECTSLGFVLGAEDKLMSTCGHCYVVATRLTADSPCLQCQVERRRQSLGACQQQMCGSVMLRSGVCRDAQEAERRCWGFCVQYEYADGCASACVEMACRDGCWTVKWHAAGSIGVEECCFGFHHVSVDRSSVRREKRLQDAVTNLEEVLNRGPVDGRQEQE